MPRNQPRENARKARSDLYRQLILDAAEGAFAQRGVEDTKMEEIAAQSGLSLGTLYSVFSGKLDLVRAVHETRLGEVLQRAADAARGLDEPLAMLLAGVRSYVEFFVVHPDYLRMHLREGYAWGLIDSSLSTREQADAWREGVAMQTALFERGIAEGVFHPGDPKRMARMMIAMQQVQLASWVEGEMELAPEELIGEIERQVRRSFCLADSAPHQPPIS